MSSYVQYTVTDFVVLLYPSVYDDVFFVNVFGCCVIISYNDWFLLFIIVSLPPTSLRTAVLGIELGGYCAYKLPQMSTRPLKDASPFTYSLLFKEASFETTNLPFNDISLVTTTS